MLKKCYMVVLLGLCVLTFSACSSNSSQKPATQANTDSNETKEITQQPKTEEPKVETAEEQEITLNLALGERTGTYTGEMKNGECLSKYNQSNILKNIEKIVICKSLPKL